MIERKIEPESLSAWLGMLSAWVVTLYFLCWLLEAIPGSTKALYHFSREIFPWLMDGSILRILLLPDGSWQVVSSLQIAGVPGTTVAFEVDQQILLRAVLPIPMAFALLLSVGVWEPLRLSVAALSVWSVALATVATFIAATLTVIVNNAPAVLDDDLLPKPPDFQVVAPAVLPLYSAAIQYLAYFFVIVAPLISPVIVWVAIGHSRIRALLLRGNETKRLR